jgi:hypothetical protein
MKLIFGGATNMLKIPEKFIKELNDAGETGMDYQIVSIVLKDGRRFNQVSIVGGRIGHIRGMDNIPFKEDDIDQIIVTHDKWDFSKE